MINDSDKVQHQKDRERDEAFDQDRVEQFNELSEISLEERMNVADKIGIPVDNAGEAAATGTASGVDEAAPNQNDRLERDRQHNQEER